MSALPVLRDEAFRLLDRGWSVIPVRGKRAACQWKPYQREAPDAAALRRWFGPGGPKGVTGLALVLGDVSGGVVCPDFDDETVYIRWKLAAPGLAEALPTVRTARGFHVYFRRLGERLRDTIGGEVRGLGGYSLLPPSVHPSGVAYRYVVPLPDGDLPELAEGEYRLLISATEKAEKAETPETTQTTENTDEIEGWVLLTPEVLQAIKETLPPRLHTRWRSIFEFCRALKAIPSMADAPVDALRPIVREWHRQALPNIATKAFEETWIDFRRGWGKVILPKGKDSMNIVFERARATPPPVRTRDYDQEPVRLLGSICRELQRASGDRPFFLGTRTAGRLLAVDHTTAWRWMYLLTADGLLEVVERGGQAHNPRKASRFRWIGGD